MSIFSLSRALFLSRCPAGIATTDFVVPGGGADSQNGDTALLCAAAFVFKDCARLLIDAGADVEAKNKVRRRSLLV